jgi:hypothetical protein
MFNRKVATLVTLSFCFFESIGKNMDNQTLDKKLGKPVSSFVRMLDLTITDQFKYTTELSRILLVGEPRAFETVRTTPLIKDLIVVAQLFNYLFFANRFEKFIKTGEKCSKSQLQEAIKDAAILTTYNTNAYSANKLLDYLSKALQSKIGYIKDQIKHDSKWDQKSFSSLKKSGALALGLTAFVVITNKYIGDPNIESKVSSLEFLSAIATLGLLPVSYQVLKNCYKVLTINPNASTENLDKYEELLSFVQKLKEQLETNGFINFELNNGRTATLKDNKVIFN